MGLSNKTYIGPYVRATETFEKKRVDTCENHGFPAGASFCPTCGQGRSRRWQLKESATAPLGWNEQYQKAGKKSLLSDYLCKLPITYSQRVQCAAADNKQFRTVIYVPNCRWQDLGLPPANGEEGEWLLDDLDVAGSVQKFKEVFADELSYLAQWFQLEVHFGVLRYA